MQIRNAAATTTKRSFLLLVYSILLPPGLCEWSKWSVEVHNSGIPCRHGELREAFLFLGAVIFIPNICQMYEKRPTSLKIRRPAVVQYIVRLFYGLVKSRNKQRSRVRWNVFDTTRAELSTYRLKVVLLHLWRVNYSSDSRIYLPRFGGFLHS